MQEERFSPFCLSVAPLLIGFLIACNLSTHLFQGGPVGQHPGAQQIGPGGAAPPGAHSDNSHDGIMDLAHHSENSN